MDSPSCVGKEDQIRSSLAAPLTLAGGRTCTRISAPCLYLRGAWSQCDSVRFKCHGTERVRMVVLFRTMLRALNAGRRIVARPAAVVRRGARLMSQQRNQRVVGVVRESYGLWERRAPLCPQHVRALVDSGIRVQVGQWVVVQSVCSATKDGAHATRERSLTGWGSNTWHACKHACNHACANTYLTTYLHTYAHLFE